MLMTHLAQEVAPSPRANMHAYGSPLVPRVNIPFSDSRHLIGRASLARENEAGGSWGQEVHILHVNI